MARLSPQDPQPGTIQSRASLTPPVQTYARSLTGTAMGSRENIASERIAGPGQRTAMVVRIPRRNGIRYFYGYGLEEADQPQTYPGGNDGAVHSSAFQRMRQHLFDFVLNDGLFAAGYPRNLGLSFRMPTIKTNPTGGSTNSRMDTKPQFTRVQSVARYSTVPQSYATKGAAS